ncbi:MAG: hypothetical protein ACRC62_19195 [Microcoleus sp.]
MAKMEARYKGDIPVLVHVGADAKPIMAIEAKEGPLNDKNVQSFLAECVPLINQASSKLPVEAGGGKDKGFPVGNNLVVPTALEMARSCLAPHIQEGYLQAKAQLLEKAQIWKGGEQALVAVTVGSVSKTDSPNLREVIVTGQLVTQKPDGSATAEQWARTFIVGPVQKPKYILTQNAIQEKYNFFRSRHLEIINIKDAKEVLP